MNSPFDEIKAKLPIEELVGQYVQLKKAGRNLKGLCPFHNEKSPSFVVSPERGIAYCFGCNKGGDIFKFIQEIENCDFSDALKILAEKAGVTLEKFEMREKAPKGQKEKFLDIYESAANFYIKQLWESEDGIKVLNYLKGRGLSEESIRLFRLGYSPDSFEATCKKLQESGYSKKELVASGIALTSETTLEKIYDRFRGRLMFPIIDALGRVVAFGGRALKKDQEPKYLNSAESPIYHKGNLFYGFAFSKKEIKNSGVAVLVEGYMDLIAAYQAGVKNVVATSGTALTEMQLRLLSPLAKTLILSFDMDLAGREAVKRAYELSLGFDFEVRVASLPEGKDPAEYAKEHDDLDNILAASPLYTEYFYSKLIKDYGTDNYAAKKKILADFLPFFTKLKSNLEKDNFIRRLSMDLGLNETQIYDEIRNFKLPLNHPARQMGVLEATLIHKKWLPEEILLGLLYEYEDVFKNCSEKMFENMFSSDIIPIYKGIIDYYNGGSSGDLGVALGFLPYEQTQKLSLLSLFIAEEYGEMSSKQIVEEAEKLIKSIKKQLMIAKTKSLQKLISEAEKKGDKSEMERCLAELTAVYKTLGN